MERRTARQALEPPRSELARQLWGVGLSSLTLVVAWVLAFVSLVAVAGVSHLLGTGLDRRSLAWTAAPIALVATAFAAREIWGRVGHPSRGVALVLLATGAGVATAASPFEPLIGRDAAIVAAVLGSAVVAGAALYPGKP